MIIISTIIFATLGYVIYKSKDEVVLIEKENIDSNNLYEKEEDDLFKELEDLFI